MPSRLTKKAVQIIKDERKFKDGSKQKLLLETLMAIKKCAFSDDEKAGLIERLFEIKTNDERLKAFRLVNDIIAFGGTDYLTKPNLESSLSALYQKQFNVQVDGFAEKYAATIGFWQKYRNTILKF